MNSLHTRLRQTFRWYHNWHEHPRHKHTHWLSFLVAVLSVFSFISGQVNLPLEEFNVVVSSINTAQAQTTSTALYCPQYLANGRTPSCGCYIGSLGGSYPTPMKRAVLADAIQDIYNQDPGGWDDSIEFESFKQQVIQLLINRGETAAQGRNGNCNQSLNNLAVRSTTVNGVMMGEMYEIFRDGANCGDNDCDDSNGNGIPDCEERWRVGLAFGCRLDYNPYIGSWDFVGGPRTQSAGSCSTVCVAATPTPRPRFIYFLMPRVVQAGDIVTIEGSNLHTTIRATNAAGAVATLTGTMNADGTIVTFTVPAGSPPGNYSIRVGPSATDQSNAVGIEVLTGTAPPIITGTEPPVITSINPTTVRWGDSFQIFGEFLSPNVQIIDSNGTSTNVLGNVNDGNTIVTVFISSNFQPGIYNVGVTNNNGSALANDILTITETQVETNETVTTLEIPAASNFGELMSSAYNYSLILVGLIVFIMFMWAGFLWVTSAANPGNIGTAKMYMTNAIAGAILLIAAFLILNTINPELRTGGFEVPGISAGPGPGGGSTQTAAQRLLSMGNVNFSTNASCGGNYHASQNIQDMAAGGMPTVCTSGSCTPCVAGGASGSIYVFPQILNGLSDLAELGTGFTVTSFTTGNHSANSYHYQGRAVDIVVNGANTVWMSARGFLDDMGGNAICEDPGDPDNDQRGPGGLIVTQDDPDCVSSGMSHIHWQY